VVLGFPANDFLSQEPGTNDEIAAFCATTYDVQFPLFEKITVKGDAMHPLYREMIAAQPAAAQKPGGDLAERLAKHGVHPEKPSDVFWNFEKFLVSRDGRVVGRFSTEIAPDDPMLLEAIEAELSKTV
jgi:glutathione peroxidase